MKYGIFSGFPGVGKSTLWEAARVGKIANLTALNLGEVKNAETVAKYQSKPIIVDSDSSYFPKENFPHNYIQHIAFVEENYDQAIILVSSHLAVREALAKANIDYTVVVPDIAEDSREEYMKRYEWRGSNEAFRKLINENWESFVNGCINDPNAMVIQLRKDEYLEDIILEKE